MGLDFHGVYLRGYITAFHQEPNVLEEDPINPWNKISKKGPISSKQYELWVDKLEPEMTEHAKALKCLSYVRDVTCTLNLGYNSKLEVTLAPPFEEGLAFINSELIQWGIGHLMMTIGYSTGNEIGNQTLPLGGFIQMPTVKIGRDIQITLTAMGIGYHLQNAGDMNGDEKLFEGCYSYGVAVKRILDKYSNLSGPDSDTKDTSGLLTKNIYADFTAAEMNPRSSKCHRFFKEEVDNRVITKPTKPTDPGIKRTTGGFKGGQNSKESNAAYKTRLDEDNRYKAELAAYEATLKSNEALKIYQKTNNKRMLIQKGGVSDWWFVYSACKNHNLDLFILDRNVQIRNPDHWKKGDPAMIFALKADINTTSSPPVYPILEFECPQTHMFYRSGIGALKQTDYNEEGEPIRSTIDDTTARPTQVGTTETYDPESKIPGTNVAQECAASIPGDPSTNASVQADAMYKRIISIAGTEINITSMGIPNLLPGMVISVRGIAPQKFDGKYGVQEVEHKIGANGFTTKFKAIGGYFPSPMTKPASGEVNVDPPLNLIKSAKDLVVSAAKTAVEAIEESMEPRPDTAPPTSWDGYWHDGSK